MSPVLGPTSPPSFSLLDLSGDDAAKGRRRHSGRPPRSGEADGETDRGLEISGRASERFGKVSRTLSPERASSSLCPRSLSPRTNERKRRTCS